MRPLAETEARYERYRAAGEFLAIARAYAIAKGDPAQAIRLSGLTPRVIDGVKGMGQFAQHRAAVAAGTTTDSTNAGPLVNYTQAADAFVGSLRNASAFHRMVGDMRPFPLHTRVAMTTAGASGDTVFEGNVKLISNLTLESHSLIERKSVCALVVTQELLMHGGDALFNQELTRAVAYTVDSKALSVLTASISPVASQGSTANALSEDIAAALNVLRIGQTSKVYCVTTSAIIKAIAVGVSAGQPPTFPNMTISGGDISGITFIPSDACPDAQMIFVDCDGIAANSGSLELGTIKYGDIIMDAAPDSPPSSSSVLSSLWQKNQVALTCHAWYGLERLRNSAVAVISGAHYQGDSP